MILFQIHTSYPPRLAKSHPILAQISALSKYVSDPCHVGIKLAPSCIPILPCTLIPALISDKSPGCLCSSATKLSLWISHTQNRSFLFHKLLMLTLLTDSLQWKLNMCNWPFPCSSRAISSTQCLPIKIEATVRFQEEKQNQEISLFLRQRKFFPILLFSF